MYANTKKQSVTPETMSIPMDATAEAKYFADLIEKQARIERTVKFKYLVKNKNLKPSQLAGIIMENVNVNGHDVTVCATVTEAEARKFQENRFLMFMFN